MVNKQKIVGNDKSVLEMTNMEEWRGVRSGRSDICGFNYFALRRWAFQSRMKGH